ncbi:MAG: hypothetical protein Q8P67_01335 [archaeon]|nr:hypothetical protein [archaeon]
MLKEVISSEKSYLGSLQSARNNFETPLREKVSSEKKSILTSFGRLAAVCKESDIDRIFGHIHELIEVSEEFLRRAEPMVEAFVSGAENSCFIGRVFLEMSNMFSMFARYVVAYAEAMDLVATLSKDLLGSPSRFAKLMEELKPKANLQTLESLMITPIQRVPRYILLLRELIKHTPECSAELEVLRQARGAMKVVGKSINERKRQEEEFESLVALDKCFNPPVNIAKRGRILIKQGVIQRLSGRDRIISCYLHVFSDMMLVSKQHRPNDFEADLIWPFHKIKVVHPTDQASWGLPREILLQTGRAFYIRTPFELGAFFAPSPADRDEWLGKINEFINIRFSLKPLAN